MDNYDAEAWGQLESHGLDTDYISFRDGKIGPAFTAEDLIKSGWLTKGTKVRFINKNGYDMELERARQVFIEGQVLTVAKTTVNMSDSSYVFDEAAGNWNTVMFEKLPEKFGEDLYD